MIHANKKYQNKTETKKQNAYYEKKIAVWISETYTTTVLSARYFFLFLTF